MKKLNLIGLLLLSLGTYTISYADKIEKNKTVLNSSCKPLGSRCTGVASGSIANITYIYNEPHAKSFSMQFTEEEVLHNKNLQEVLQGKSILALEEEMPIPDDVIAALKMPAHYTVPIGRYAISFRNGIYTIVYQE